MPYRHRTVSTLAVGLALALGGSTRAQVPGGADAAPPLPSLTPGLPPVPPAAPALTPPPPLPPTAPTAPYVPPETPTTTEETVNEELSGPEVPLSAPGTAASTARSEVKGVIQLPVPSLNDTVERSGLMRRFVPIIPHLPPDARRDQWYDTRWGDPPNLRKHPNFYTNGGMFGLPMKADCTVSYAPFFYGAPGQGNYRPDCKPHHNFFHLSRAILHPFKPVGMYYDQGTYVPVYDLDPVVPGPTAWPWPFYRRLTNWGG